MVKETQSRERTGKKRAASSPVPPDQDNRPQKHLKTVSGHSGAGVKTRPRYEWFDSAQYLLMFVDFSTSASAVKLKTSQRAGNGSRTAAVEEPDIPVQEPSAEIKNGKTQKILRPLDVPRNVDLAPSGHGMRGSSAAMDVDSDEEDEEYKDALGNTDPDGEKWTFEVSGDYYFWASAPVRGQGGRLEVIGSYRAPGGEDFQPLPDGWMFPADFQTIWSKPQKSGRFSHGREPSIEEKVEREGETDKQGGSASESESESEPVTSSFPPGNQRALPGYRSPNRSGSRSRSRSPSPDSVDRSSFISSQGQSAARYPAVNLAYVSIPRRSLIAQGKEGKIAEMEERSEKEAGGEQEDMVAEVDGVAVEQEVEERDELSVEHHLSEEVISAAQLDKYDEDDSDEEARRRSRRPANGKAKARSMDDSESEEEEEEDASRIRRQQGEEDNEGDNEEIRASEKTIEDVLGLNAIFEAAFKAQKKGGRPSGNLKNLGSYVGHAFSQVIQEISKKTRASVEQVHAAIGWMPYSRKKAGFNCYNAYTQLQKGLGYPLGGEDPHERTALIDQEYKKISSGMSKADRREFAKECNEKYFALHPDMPEKCKSAKSQMDSAENLLYNEVMAVARRSPSVHIVVVITYASLDPVIRTLPPRQIVSSDLLQSAILHNNVNCAQLCYLFQNIVLGEYSRQKMITDGVAARKKSHVPAPAPKPSEKRKTTSSTGAERGTTTASTEARSTSPVRRKDKNGSSTSRKSTVQFKDTEKSDQTHERRRSDMEVSVDEVQSADMLFAPEVTLLDQSTASNLKAVAKKASTSASTSAPRQKTANSTEMPQKSKVKMNPPPSKPKPRPLPQKAKQTEERGRSSPPEEEIESFNVTRNQGDHRPGDDDIEDADATFARTYEEDVTMGAVQEEEEEVEADYMEKLSKMSSKERAALVYQHLRQQYGRTNIAWFKHPKFLEDNQCALVDWPIEALKSHPGVPGFKSDHLKPGILAELAYKLGHDGKLRKGEKFFKWIPWTNKQKAIAPNTRDYLRIPLIISDKGKVLHTVGDTFEQVAGEKATFSEQSQESVSTPPTTSKKPPPPVKHRPSQPNMSSPGPPLQAASKKATDDQDDSDHPLMMNLVKKKKVQNASSSSRIHPIIAAQAEEIRAIPHRGELGPHQHTAIRFSSSGDKTEMTYVKKKKAPSQRRP
ncbi:hypothetical protein CVT26_011614 [Gymnopilus dilepis]|uniref:Uncharacterized protein n=1 Tax=Gymnopilus dilepis TaxID=231916 RepID=A0A409YQL3_9AGAR|nr:hypothetical protein CVT26_011614 [Gymnopilus dilepis]